VLAADAAQAAPRRPSRSAWAVAVGVAAAVVVLVAGLLTTVIGTSNPGSHQGSAYARRGAGNHAQAGAASVAPPGPGHHRPGAGAPVAGVRPSHPVARGLRLRPLLDTAKSTGFDLKNLTTLAYFSVDVNATGP